MKFNQAEQGNSLQCKRCSELLIQIYFSLPTLCLTAPWLRSIIHLFIRSSWHGRAGINSDFLLFKPLQRIAFFLLVKHKSLPTSFDHHHFLIHHHTTSSLTGLAGEKNHTSPCNTSRLSCFAHRSARRNVAHYLETSWALIMPKFFTEKYCLIMYDLALYYLRSRMTICNPDLQPKHLLNRF